jgi:hypothetical protein
VITFPSKYLARTTCVFHVDSSCCCIFFILCRNKVACRCRSYVDNHFPSFFLHGWSQFFKEILICWVASLKCSSSRVNSKSLKKVSLMSMDQLSVWHTPSILYHLCGISSSVFGTYATILFHLYILLCVPFIFATVICVPLDHI